MPVSEYPLPSVHVDNPDPLVTDKMIDEPQVDSIKFDDGALGTALRSGGVGTQRWYMFYDGLFAVQAAILDSHLASAKLQEGQPSAYTFNFRDPDSGTLYSGVRYERYDRPVHKNKDLLTRTVILVKFP